MRFGISVALCLCVIAAGCGSAASDPCGLCDANASCLITGNILTCTCNPGFTGNGATCTGSGTGGTGGSGGGECRISFTKPRFETSTVDCVSATVCLARNNGGPLYNSLRESSHSLSGAGDGGLLCSGSEPEPTLTEWSQFSCSVSTIGDFRTFIDFAECAVGEVVVGIQGCLRLTDTDERWDIEFTDWCDGDTRPGGCFSYTRSRDISDGASCQ